MSDCKFLLKEDKIDDRDFLMSEVLTPHPSVKLPRRVDLRKQCPPIVSQGGLGSCSANAGTAAKAMSIHQPNIPLSRLYLYYYERLLNNTVGEDSGACMRDICKALFNYGVCTEDLMPYDISKFTQPPTQEAIANAEKYKNGSYRRIIGLNGIKQNIALRQQPVLVGMRVYESFINGRAAKTGYMEMPKSNERLCGGHAILVCGYIDTLFDGWLICRNSWGDKWGQRGYFMMPYKYLKDYTFDYWALNG